MINIEYTTTKDYSALNPAKFVDIKNIYNTILVPKQDIDYLIQPTDTVSLFINGKSVKQKVALDSGYINLYNQEFYYFYIAPGINRDHIKTNKYEILINEKNIKLNNYLDPTPTAKIINGLIVLTNNFRYAFNHINYSIVQINSKQILTKILKQENKYNYYMGNTNNSIHYILNKNNINTLYELNNSYENAYCKPIYNKNYELGSCTITSNGVNNIKLVFGNSIFNFNQRIKIDYLPSGTYKIYFLDNKGKPIIINKANNNVVDSNYLYLNIPSELADTKKVSSLLDFNQNIQPKKNYSNLLVNIFPYNTKFEIFGPNNYHKKFATGYQKLNNISPGTYIIKFKNNHQEILVLKNDNNYFSNI